MEFAERIITPFRDPPDTRHLDVLDGFRAILIFLVGAFHIWQQGWLTPAFTLFGEYISLDFLLRSGYIWVDGMLLLSGFLLYLPMAAGEKPLPVLTFYRRRLARIMPSYLLCILPLFVIAVIGNKYGSFAAAMADLLPHLTFTHSLFRASYTGTQLNGALWTLSVEMQFYLLFPLLSRAYRRRPLITYLAMTAAAFAFRFYAGTKPDSSLYFNQLPAFLDVYANGFAAASVYTVLRKKLGKDRWDTRLRVMFTVLFVVCICELLAIARGQASASGQEGIRHGQMDRRFPLSAVLACAMVCAACGTTGLRFLLGNRVMSFLASVSFQFYMYHQMIAVRLKEWGFPASAYDEPWRVGDRPWQIGFTVCAFLFAFVLSVLITYLFERPIARKLRK